MYKIMGFRDKLVRVIVSTFLIFMFVDQLLLVDVFSQLYFADLCQKITLAALTLQIIKLSKNR